MSELKVAQIRSQQLQIDAQTIVEHYDLLNLLSPLGDVHLWGSLQYGLMMKRDIDFVIFNEQPTLDPLIELATRLMHFPGICKVAVANHYIWPTLPGVPKSLYLSIKPIWNNQLWEIDIHVLKPEDQADRTMFPLNWYIKLTDEQRNSILLLKYQLIQEKRYGKDFYSTDVYRAVLYDNICSIAGLEEWRKTHVYT